MTSNDFAYIANLASGKQLVFNNQGALWLSLLEPIQKQVKSIIDEIVSYYDNGNYNQIKDDYLCFLNTLKEYGLVELSEYRECQIPDKIDYSIFHTFIPSITDLTIEITSRCNERCVHCYIPNSIKNHGISFDYVKAQSVIDDFAKMGGKSITFTGGEVLMYRKLVELLQYAHSKNLKIIIYSNLIALTYEHIKLFQAIDVSLIQVSLYGVTENIHDSITKINGSCSKTKQAIIKLHENGVPVRIACPVLKENKYDIINVIDFARERNIQIDLDFNITPRSDKSNDNLEHRMDSIELKECVENLVRYDKDYTIQLLKRHKHVYDQNFNLIEYMNTPICPAGFHGLYISSIGDVTTCPNLQGLKMTNINKSRLYDIWYKNKTINEIRNCLEGTFDKCIRCEARDYCCRCFARNYTETGNIKNPPNYACEMAFIFKNIVENNL